jgi:hypothetical protein
LRFYCKANKSRGAGSRGEKKPHPFGWGVESRKEKLFQFFYHLKTDFAVPVPTVNLIRIAVYVNPKRKD